MSPVVVLDRDGVLNEDSDAYIKSPAEWRPIPGSPEAVAALNRAGFKVAVASNQSGLARGLFDQATLDAIHDKMTATLTAAGGRLDGIYYCPHGPQDGCRCRKPEPGLLRQIAEDFRVPPDALIMIGDARRDLEAAQALGARAILVRTGKGERNVGAAESLGVTVYPNLAAVARQLIAENKHAQS